MKADGKPLAAARERLRRKPGRPRKAESGHITGTSPSQKSDNGIRRCETGAELSGRREESGCPKTSSFWDGEMIETSLRIC